MGKRRSTRAKKQNRRNDRTMQLSADALKEEVKSTNAKRKMRFNCPFCESSLRIPAVKKRMKIRCPRCSGKFYLYPDGRVDVPNAKGTEAQERATFESQPTKPKRTRRQSSSKTKKSEEYKAPTDDDLAEGSLFKSGQFDGTETGYRFETVTALDLASLSDLRGSMFGEPSAATERGYELLPASKVEVRTKAKKGRKRHAKKRRKKSASRELNVVEPEPVKPEPRATNKLDVVERRTSKTRQTRAIEPDANTKRRQTRSQSATRRRSTGTRRTQNLEQQSRSREIEPPQPEEFVDEPITGLSTGLQLLIGIPAALVLLMAFLTFTKTGFAGSGPVSDSLASFGRSVQRSVQKLNSSTVKLKPKKRRK